METRIVAYGELLWDLLPTGRTLGGAPFNFVYRVASLGHHATMVSRLGRDELGAEAHAIVRRLGMEDGCLQWDPDHPTGTVPITFDPRGIPDITINPDVAYDYIQPTPEALYAFAEADCVCFGTLIQRTAVARKTLETLLDSFRGSIRLLDINLRKDCWTPQTVRASVGRADVLKLNDDEAVTLAPLFGLEGLPLRGVARGLAALGNLRHVVISLGAGGAVAASRDGSTAYAPAFRVKVEDTLGSGDAFSAAFIHGLLSGWPLESALEYGNAAGAVVAAQRGATEPMDRSDVDRMVATGRRAASDPRVS